MKITLDLNLKLAVRWLIGLLLVWAAVSKLANVQDFYANLLAYRLPLPDLILRGVAACLPWLELLCGLMLLAQVNEAAALVWAALLFAVFVLATGQAWARGLDISCGCFSLQWLGLEKNEGLGKFFHSVSFAFFRALLLALGAVYLLRQQPRSAAVG